MCTRTGHIDIEALIAEATGAGTSERVYFAADIGSGRFDKTTGVTTTEWFFLKDGRRSKRVELPRGTFTYRREFDAAGGLVNFWLVETSRRWAELYGVEDFILSDEEAEGHRERLAGNKE